MTTIINAEGLILGRLASVVAKKLLQGEKIQIVNCEKALITGNKTIILEKFKTRFARAPKGNPRKGPKHSRMPDRIVTNTIKNMLPKYSKRGKNALKKLKVWISIPKHLQNASFETIPQAKKETTHKTISVGELAKLCGAKL